MTRTLSPPLSRAYGAAPGGPPAAAPFLPRSIAGRTYTGPHPNGDFMIPVVNLTAGDFTAMDRVGPGGTPLAPAAPFVPPQ
jgi:hypothetical protein